MAEYQHTVEQDVEYHDNSLRIFQCLEVGRLDVTAFTMKLHALSICFLSAVNASVICLDNTDCAGVIHSRITGLDSRDSELSERDVSQTTKPSSLPHANHIFNSVNNALKQWGSSLQHNGMSFFLVTVKQGIELYHGTSSPYPVNDTEWLAFEPEHALIFAWPPRKHRGPPPSPPPPRPASQQQIPLKARHDKRDRSEEKGYGYFHTYRTQHDLRLMYFDGQSAAKSTKGTLDTQDVVLRNKTTGDGGKGVRIEWDWEIARDLCNQTQTRWDDKIDGFLRMEGGFEIILCSFERHLDVVDIHAVESAHFGDERGKIIGLDYARAVAARYDGLGDDKASIDFDNDFLSLYSSPDTIYFEHDSRLPRVRNDSSTLDPFRKSIDDMVLSKPKESGTVNWQAVASLIVTRYAERIDFLASIDPSDDEEWLHNEVISTLRPFRDDAVRDDHHSISLCTNQFLPSDDPYTSLASQAVRAVSHRICQSLFHAADARDASSAVARIKKLKAWLQWPDFLRKGCLGCDFREKCSLPIWPSGTAEDLLHPHCIDGGMMHHGDYWEMGRPED